MKNIYTDDKLPENVDELFTFHEKQEEAAKEAAKPVRSAKQAPPPIRKITHGYPQAQQVPPGAYPQPPVYPGQPGYFPQPVYYQPDPNQPPIPVYYAPVPGQPIQGQPYPGQPVPVQPYPVYGQQPYYQPAPTSEAFPYPQAEPAPVEKAPTEKAPKAVEAPKNEAGTRVLFQSDDFDKKDDIADDIETPDTNTFNGTYNPLAFDVSEVELPSKKSKSKSPKVHVTPVSFKIDEMEIGTYELGVMTAGQRSKVKAVEIPEEEVNEPEIYTEETADEEFDFEAQLKAMKPAEEEEEETEKTEEAEEVAEETEAQEEEKEETAVKVAAPKISVASVSAEEDAGKKLSSKEIIRRAILVISLLAIIIACFSLFNEYRLHKQNKELMSDISGLIITDPPSTEEVEETTTQRYQGAANNGDDALSITVPTTTRPLSPEEQFEILKAENPDITFPANMQLKYAKLYAQNPDFVGYLSAEGSDLDFPIVQGSDDDEYVEKNFYGEYTKYACPFVTVRNNIEALDMNTVIYGHHMRDGSIFATLDQYRTLEGYKEAPVISFNTIYQDYKFKVIATFITNIYASDDNGYIFNYFWTNLTNELNYNAYLNQLSQRSLYNTGVDVLPTDRLITLSTCCNDFSDARLVVVGRLVRPGESAEVDTSLATENDNPRYPQAYYDATGKTNPFVGAYNWEIS